MARYRGLWLGMLAMALIAMSGCASLARHEAVPRALTAAAQVPGLADVRYLVGDPRDMARLAEDVAATWPRERAWLQSQGKTTRDLPPSHLLALSGGGDKGAFGAGLLNGWSAAGTRPEFLLVTGVSTGALIAPFAFLGARHDDTLRQLYTMTGSQELIRVRSLMAALTEDHMADTAPLRALLRRHIDQDFLDDVAAEFRKGRELWISTTNLDASRRVIWNMTRLAASRHPRAVALFHDIMMASAAIPGAFPPVMIEVEAEGRAYQEMHVDGGAMAQVFVYPPDLQLARLSADRDGERPRRLYVLMNARIDPDWAQTERWVIPIASRAINSMINSQGIGDLYRIYLTAQRDGVAFNLAHIPGDFEHPRREEFDTAFMQALYARGYQMALKGFPWLGRPPGFEEEIGPAR